MSSLWRDTGGGSRVLKPMRTEDLDAVMVIEGASHVRPWSRGNFVDSLASDYVAEALFDGDASLIGYCIAAPGVDEMHLLNLSVAPERRRCGHARYLLASLVERCRADDLSQLWLEVRVGNAAARRLYRDFGLHEVGMRRAYYPPAERTPGARSEDAVLMRLRIDRDR